MFLDVQQQNSIKNILYGPEAVQFLFDILETLQAIHNIGIIHRDLKPDNIIIHKDDFKPWIVDFGIAKEEEQTKKGSNTCIGTRGFKAPEIDTGEVGWCSDIYSLGATLLDLTQRLTEDDCRWDEVLQRCPFPEELKTIIGKMVKITALDRYQSCSDIIHDLQNMLRNPKITNWTLVFK